MELRPAMVGESWGGPPRFFQKYAVKVRIITILPDSLNLPVCLDFDLDVPNPNRLLPGSSEKSRPLGFFSIPIPTRPNSLDSFPPQSSPPMAG